MTQCIENLRDNNDNFIEPENLFLLRVDVEQDGMHYPNFFYELYQYFSCNSVDKINLTKCENIKTIIEIYDTTFQESIDKYNSSSRFYNDICYTTKSENNTDIILSRRQHNYIDYNMSACGVNYEFIQYNTEDNKAVCSCNVITKIPFLKDLNFDKIILLNSFIDINNVANVKMLKCYKIVFNKKNIMKNIGFFIFIFFIILNVIFIVLFYYRDYKKLLFEIKKMKFGNNCIIGTISNKDDNLKIPTKKPRKKRKRKKNQKFDKINDLKASETNIIKKIDITKKENKENSSKNESQSLYLYKKDKNNKQNDLSFKSNKKVILNHSKLNSLNYKEAFKKDKRNYIQYYISLLLTNHSFIYIFYSNDYNSKI